MAHQELYGQVQNLPPQSQVQNYQPSLCYIWMVHLNGSEGSGAGGEASKAVGDHRVGGQAHGTLRQAAYVNQLIMNQQIGMRRHSTCGRQGLTKSACSYRAETKSQCISSWIGKAQSSWHRNECTHELSVARHAGCEACGMLGL